MSMTTERVRPNMSEDLARPSAMQESANPAKPMAIGPIDSAAAPEPQVPTSGHGGIDSPYNYKVPASKLAPRGK